MTLQDIHTVGIVVASSLPWKFDVNALTNHLDVSVCLHMGMLSICILRVCCFGESARKMYPTSKAMLTTRIDRNTGCLIVCLKAFTKVICIDSYSK